MTDNEALVQAIKDAIETVCEEHNSGDGFSDKEWTARLMMRMGGLIEDKRAEGYYAYGAAQPDGGEFLYDLCWLQYDEDGYLIRAAVALESEWGTADDVHDDFQKLQLACADLRVMILSALTKSDMAKVIGMLKTSVERFAGNATPGDYFLCCWCSETRGFNYERISG